MYTIRGRVEDLSLSIENALFEHSKVFRDLRLEDCNIFDDDIRKTINDRLNFYKDESKMKET